MRMLIAAAALAALTGTAMAADLPLKARPMAAPIAMNWTGCYLAGGGGYGMWNQRHYTATDPAVTTFSPLSAGIDSGGRGWFGTVQGGCDYQVNQSWVIGVFADYDFADISGRFAPGASGGLPDTGNEKLSWQWAVGGRVGYLVLPNLLAYLSGGYTQAHFNSVHLFNNTVVPVDAGIQLDGRTYDGWFLGSGYEYGLNWLSPSLFWKTEYRFAQFGSENPQYRSISLNTPTSQVEHSTKYVQTIRSELVWRFNWR